MPEVEVTKYDAVAVIRLHRPEVRNAINDDFATGEAVAGAKEFQSGKGRGGTIQ